MKRLPILLIIATAAVATAALAQAGAYSQGEGATAQIIDLPAALQLAGARSLDLQIAREKLAEAKAAYESAVWQFFPSITPGVGYRRHDDLLQDVAGNIINVRKDSFTVGPVIALLAGILILAMPRLLNFIVAIYLIAIGVLGLLAYVKF